MRVIIETILHANQRYDTCGDWWFDKSEGSEHTLHIRVSNLNDWRKSMSVAYHELFEALVCLQRGITAKQVDDFDTTWKPHDDYVEPGDDPEAPYHDVHQLAMAPEHILADALELVWGEYEAALNQLSQD